MCMSMLINYANFQRYWNLNAIRNLFDAILRREKLGFFFRGFFWIWCVKKSFVLLPCRNFVIMKTAIKYDYAIIIKVSLKSIKTGVAKGSIHCVTQKKFLLVSWTRSKKAVTARSYQKYKKDKVNFADEYAKQIRWKIFLLRERFVEFFDLCQSYSQFQHIFIQW